MAPMPPPLSTVTTLNNVLKSQYSYVGNSTMPPLLKSGPPLFKSNPKKPEFVFKYPHPLIAFGLGVGAIVVSLAPLLASRLLNVHPLYTYGAILVPAILATLVWGVGLLVSEAWQRRQFKIRMEAAAIMKALGPKQKPENEEYVLWGPPTTNGANIGTYQGTHSQTQ